MQRVVTHWDNPIRIADRTFEKIQNACMLYVPIGKATAYSKAGWNIFPNLKEAGILKIDMNEGGTVTYAEKTLTNTTEEFFFPPYKSFYVSICPNLGKIAKIVWLNEKDVSGEIENGLLFFDEPEENSNLVVIFTSEGNQQGDVNDDALINITDVNIIADYILKQTSEKTIRHIGDMNGDGILNITDEIILINEILTK